MKARGPDHGNYRHGMHDTGTYKSWEGAKQRCHNPKHHKYPLYGARGVIVCDRWRNSFKNFLTDMGERPAGTSLDRYPDRNGNYEPGNCRWATVIEQNNNRSINHRIVYRGEEMSVSDARRLAGVVPKTDTVCDRLRAGWPVEIALETPVESRRIIST